MRIKCPNGCGSQFNKPSRLEAHLDTCGKTIANLNSDVSPCEATTSDVTQCERKFEMEKTRRLKCETEVNTLNSLFRLAMGEIPDTLPLEKNRVLSWLESSSTKAGVTVLDFGAEDLSDIHVFLSKIQNDHADGKLVFDRSKDSFILDFIEWCRLSRDRPRNHSTKCTVQSQNTMLKRQNGIWKRCKTFPNGLWDIVVTDYFKLTNHCEAFNFSKSDDFRKWRRDFEAKIRESSYKRPGSLTDTLVAVHQLLWDFSKSTISYTTVNQCEIE